MLALLHLAALAQYQLNAAELALTESAFVRAVAKSQSPELIQLYYQLLLSGKKDLPYAPDPRTGLEMALLRAIAFVPATSASVDNPVPSARAAALTAAGIPSEPTAVQSTVVPAAPLQSSTTTHNSASQNPLNQAPAQYAEAHEHNAQAQEHYAQAHEHAAIEPAHAEALSTAPIASQHRSPHQESAPAVSSEPVIDPVTASIMARRGLLPSGESAGGKKPERQQAPVTPQAAPIVFFTDTSSCCCVNSRACSYNVSSCGGGRGNFSCKAFNGCAIADKSDGYSAMARSADSHCTGSN